MKLEKLANNFHKLHTGVDEYIWFSYETPIAFRSYGIMYIRENDWGTTTGKHLNMLDRDKAVRIPSDNFERIFENEMLVEEVV